MSSTSFGYSGIQADEQAVYAVKRESTYTKQGNAVSLWTLFALHAQDGSLLWSNATQSVDDTHVPAGGRPILSAQVLYLLSSSLSGDSSVSSFRPQDGKQLGTMQTRFGVEKFVPPDHLYGLTTNKGESFCMLHPNDGTQAWCTKTGYHSRGLIAVGQDTVYLEGYTISRSKATPDGVYVLDQSDGGEPNYYTIGNDPTQAVIESIALAQ